MPGLTSVKLQQYWACRQPVLEVDVCNVQ